MLGNENSPHPASCRLNLWFALAVALLFLLFCLTYLLRPIMEPDFFWHLKTGEWIWQHKQLPVFDPFSFTGPQTPDARQLVILKGYWLAQLGYHTLVAACGLWGIFLLRIILLAAFFTLFLWMFARHQVNRLLALALLSLLVIFFLENYALERPQVFTFLAIGLLVICYRWGREHFQVDGSISPPLVAAFTLVAVWSNLHGGVLLAQATLAVMACVELAVFARGKDRQRFLRMLAFAGVALAGSLLAPSQLGIGDFLSLLGLGQNSLSASQSQTNYEYYSVFTWLIEIKNYKLLIPVALSLTSLLAVKEAVRRGHHLETVLLLVFWVFAYRNVRYLPIAMTFSLLFIAWNYRSDGLLRHASIPLLIGAVLSFGLWTTNEFGHFARARAQGLVDPLNMPQQAADFLQGQQFKGRILNPVNWGGYLMWRLGPEVQVAGDGRVLDVAAYEEVLNLFKGGAGVSGTPLWREYADRYQVNAALVPLMNGQRPSQMAQGMASDPDWREVYRDQLSKIFVRRISL